MQQKLITTNPLPNIDLPSLGDARLADWRRACLQACLAKYLKIEQGKGQNTTRGIPQLPIPLKQQPA